MEKEKICRACGKKIIEKKERYVHNEDWAFGKFEVDSWWHLNCFKRAMNRELTALEKQAQTMLYKAGKIFNTLPAGMIPKTDEVYEIK